MKRVTTGLAIGLLSSQAMAATATAAAAPSMEEMWELLQQQQAEIAELKQRLAATDEEVQMTTEMVEATATLVEEGGMSGSLASEWASKTSLGGYGEMHYNNLEDQNGDGDSDQIDYHRYVLFVNHEYSEDTRFFSEVELEHSLAGDGKPGEVELEQAYIEHDLNDATRLRAGLFLVPVGMLNETHEPPTFYGVERNSVEKNIIPTTWWEGGVALNGELAPGVNYDVAFSSGLSLDSEAGKFKIRDGRQKVAEADASKGAFTAALSYTGVPGLQVGGAVHYQQDLYQGNFSHEIDAVLVELHAAYNNGPFGLRALAASWDIDDDIERIQLGADTQEGWYVEPSFKVTRDIGLFARYSQWDNQAGGGGDTEFEQYDVGVNYWLEDNVVFKLDYQVQESPDSEKELDGINLGVGFNF
ncbi:MAG: porin [Halioglobus sp.]|nr:porin [Halioglobus sp.]